MNRRKHIQEMPWVGGLVGNRVRSWCGLGFDKLEGVAGRYGQLLASDPEEEAFLM